MLKYVFLFYLICLSYQSCLINCRLDETSTISNEYSTLEEALEAELTTNSPNKNIFLEIGCGNFSLITPKNISNVNLTIQFIFLI